MKNNFKIMKTKADLNEPLKNLGSFSNPKNWAQEMGFYNPAWVASFYAQSCEVPESKGSDPTVHLIIHFKSHNSKYISFDGADSNDTSDNPESTTFSFRNHEIMSPKRLTHEPSALISLNNPERNKNESFNYDSDDELEVSRVKRRRPGLGLLSDRTRSTMCPSDLGSVGSARSVSMRSLCSSAFVKPSFNRSQSLSGATSWQRCYNDKGQYDEVETLYRMEQKKTTYSTLDERPPFYPPYSKGIPALYGVHTLLRKSSSNNSSTCNTPPSFKACSPDSPKLKRQNSELSATPERGNVRGSSCRSMPLLSYDESEFDDQTSDGVSVDMDEEEEEALRQVCGSRVVTVTDSGGCSSDR
jgi:hypothetical protein